MAEQYGDFEEVTDVGAIVVQEAEGPVRVRMPQQGEFIGIVVQRFGGKRMEVKTTDGKSRNCRVPGRFERSLWLRPRDVVLIKPWSDDDSKGDVIYKYSSSAINQLRKKGILNTIKLDF